MTSTKDEIEEFRKYLKNPEKVKEDILQQDQAIHQRIRENISNNHRTSGFNRPAAFSIEDLSTDKLIPTNYCWDSNAKKVIGYPNRFLCGYPITCKNPRFITFLDINPNHDEDYQMQIESLYSRLKQNVTQSANVFDFDKVIPIADLDEVVQNVIIPGFLKTLNNAESILNSNEMSVPDLFITHNYSLEDLYNQLNGQKDINQFLENVLAPRIVTRRLLDYFLSHSGLVFNCDDLRFIYSLAEDNLNNITRDSIFLIVSELAGIFANDYYQKTRFAYTKAEQEKIKDGLIDLNLRFAKQFENN